MTLVRPSPLAGTPDCQPVQSLPRDKREAQQAGFAAGRPAASPAACWLDAGRLPRLRCGAAGGRGKERVLKFRSWWKSVC